MNINDQESLKYQFSLVVIDFASFISIADLQVVVIWLQLPEFLLFFFII